MRTIHDILTQQPFFDRLNPDQVRALAETARYRRFRPNELVFHDGNLANRFYLIVKGSVSLEATAADGQPVRFQAAGPGELLGWTWMHANDVRELRARALEPTEVIYFCSSQLTRQCDQDQSLGYQLFRRVSENAMQRLQTARRQLLHHPAPVLAVSSEWSPGEH